MMNESFTYTRFSEFRLFVLWEKRFPNQCRSVDRGRCLFELTCLVSVDLKHLSALLPCSSSIDSSSERLNNLPKMISDEDYRDFVQIMIPSSLRSIQPFLEDARKFVR